MHRILRPSLSILFISLVLSGGTSPAFSQSKDAPLTSQEVVRLVYQLPAQPGKRDEVIAEIRRRGIGFALTDGLRSVVATKSGNDALLRRTLEEAERRRLNPVASTLPPETEGQDILEKTRVATLAAADAMPDFIVRQQITRSTARGTFTNWQVNDRLTIAVSYRANAGEEYKVLAVNGLPPAKELKEGRGYEELGGASSSGEYVSMLAALFKEESRAKFQMVDTDTLRGRRAIVYEFEVQQSNSRQSLKAGKDNAVVVGYRGRVWVDRENYRVLRMEDIATDIPADFPLTGSSALIDYDWATIAERKYLLPSYIEIKMTVGSDRQAFQSRNEIRFRNYQKFGTEVKILDEVDDEEVPENKP